MNIIIDKINKYCGTDVSLFLLTRTAIKIDNGIIPVINGTIINHDGYTIGI